MMSQYIRYSHHFLTLEKDIEAVIIGKNSFYHEASLQLSQLHITANNNSPGTIQSNDNFVSENCTV